MLRIADVALRRIGMRDGHGPFDLIGAARAADQVGTGQSCGCGTEHIWQPCQLLRSHQAGAITKGAGAARALYQVDRRTFYRAHPVRVTVRACRFRQRQSHMHQTPLSMQHAAGRALLYP